MSLKDPFSRQEAEAIIADMTAHYPAPIANYVEFKFFTGLRTSESFGLHWSDVDLAGKRVPVHRAIVRSLGRLDTKTNPGTPSDPEQPSARGRAATASTRRCETSMSF